LSEKFLFKPLLVLNLSPIGDKFVIHIKQSLDTEMATNTVLDWILGGLALSILLGGLLMLSIGVRGMGQSGNGKNK
jgi:hypothetical protein